LPLARYPSIFENKIKDMTEFQDSREKRKQWRNEWRMKHRSSHGHVWTGVFILIIGIAALLKATLTDFPDWIFGWEALLIAIGFFLGLRHGFRGATWFILILVGGAFLLDDIYPDIEMRRYTWPLVLIVVGLFFIFRPRRRGQSQGDEKKSGGIIAVDVGVDSETSYSKEDIVNATSIFSGTNKSILSKNFKGGEIVNIFGGTELNLSQADMNNEAIIETTTIFGGIKLIIPSNWTVKTEAAVIFGGIDDKRPMPALNEPTNKVLTIKGTVIFGGIDIKSH
jgi:predicted membrane protein